MKGLSFSLSARGVYYQVLVAYSLMSLLPILIVLYLSFYYILPTIPVEERFAFTDPVVQATVWTIILFPLLGLWMVVTMAKRIEKLATTIREIEEKTQGAEEKSKVVPGSQDEIEELAKEFFQMRNAITKQMEQLGDFQSKLDDSNLKLVEANKQLKELSIRDGLTALYNRRYFDGRLEEEAQRALRYNRVFALEMIDIDHFKKLNDTYGHACGDEVLKQVATIMRENTRDTDIVCRYGGEEFCVVLLEADEKRAYHHAERLREAVSAYIFSNGQTPLSEKVTVSVGIGMFIQDARDARELVESADSALYAAKAGGRNQVKCFSELQKQESRA